ncbi:hypothetical protein [Tissierella sp.]|uniref:hypothetical protein n=1 Tax=Tissierella sp. TaxID=41274 RepID=UPI002854BE1B|nr:hypothetical protein [Tissierella sp.]MDR7857341.1 hypothetical protein [Tissierella sp.]
MKKYLTSLATLFLVILLTSSYASAFTPPGLAKKGGLPPGIQKKFIQQEKDKKEYNTTIKDINLEQRRVVIEDGTAILVLLVSDEAKIELNKKSAKLEDIMKNDDVFMKLDKNNTITELKATRESETVYTVEGRLSLVDKKENKIYIYENNKLDSYKLRSDVTVRINGEKSSISGLTTGMELKLTIEGDRVKLIEASKDVQTKIIGTIIAIDYNRMEFVLQEGTKVTLYKAQSNTPIKIDGEIKTFSNLLVGMTLEAYVKDQNIISIEAKSLSIENQKGVVKAINIDKNEIVLTQGNKETLFKINKNVIVKINGVQKTLKDIAVNMDVQLTIQSGEVIEITINQLIQSFEGRIIAKDVGNKPTVTIQVGNEIKVFSVRKDLNIIEIEVGKEVIIHVKDSEVIAIVAK